MVGVWLFLFSPDGLVNQILGPLAPNPSWLVNSTWAMPSIAFFVTWKQLGFFILLYLAALQNVPKELYESAADGRGRAVASRSWSVTVPGVRPATALVLLLAIITGANLFTEPYLLTGGGGPDGASTTPVLLMYQKGIEQGHPDVASAIGVMLVIAVLIIALVSPLGHREGKPMTRSLELTENDRVIGRPGRKPGRVQTRRRGGLRAARRGAGVPVPVLLHADRLAAGGARTPRWRAPSPTRPT